MLHGAYGIPFPLPLLCFSYPIVWETLIHTSKGRFELTTLKNIAGYISAFNSLTVPNYPTNACSLFGYSRR